jgi:hypothetical protein
MVGCLDDRAGASGVMAHARELESMPSLLLHAKPSRPNCPFSVKHFHHILLDIGMCALLVCFNHLSSFVLLVYTEE